jgi:hypothetical protein
VPTEQRQRLTTPRVLTTHPPETTDSFVLYIKATVLLSKVKIFNLRFKAKFQSPVVVGVQVSSPQAEEIDPRDTPAFKALDGAISSFKMTFPREYRDPIPNGVVDSYLYVAHLVPHTCVSPSWKRRVGADRNALRFAEQRCCFMTLMPILSLEIALRRSSRWRPTLSSIWCT